MKWTKKQEEAINENGEILVAAAAGSGKTSVLVERNIRKILKDKVDINKILAITFTTAAANEVKERILLSLYNELDKNEDDNIKKQIRLLPKANISTLHSFCFNLIKENFFDLNISSDVAVSKNEERELLLQEALDEILDIEYEMQEPYFIQLVNFYSSYRNDDYLRQDIIKIYSFLNSIPFYEDWTHEAISKIEEENTNYAETIYGKIIIKEVKEIIKGSISRLEKEKEALSFNPELIKFKETIAYDIQMLEKILNISDWDLLYEYLNMNKFSTWPSKKGLNSEIKDRAKEKRDVVRDDYNLIKKRYIREKTETIIEDNLNTVTNIKTLFSLSKKLEEKYSELKQKKNLLDFDDLEKLALKLLVEKKDGKYIKTETAIEISKKHVEIQVDEYQDINKIQDLIIWAVSNNNVFRVGDLKQSIYKFRKANPDIFIEKYNSFIEKDDKNIDKNIDESNNLEDIKSLKNKKINFNSKSELNKIKGSKILLYQNFRSRKNIIDFCNDLFSKIMSKDLGEIEYDEKEYLNYAANYDNRNITTDILLVSKGLTTAEKGIDEIDDFNNIDGASFINSEEENNIVIQTEEAKEVIEGTKNLQLEAYLIADKIKDLIDSKFQVKDSDELRDIEYRDIVILLRSAKDKSDIIEKTLYEKGIPVYSDSSNNFFESTEIATVISLLKIIDNPLLDIDFVSVLRSFFGGFDLNEITRIRNVNNKVSMYESLIEYSKKNNDEKSKKFINYLSQLKEIEKYLGITKLLNKILIESGYINFITLENNGEFKKANLKLFLTRAEEYEATGNIGLYRFIQYLERLEINNSDIASANIIGEKENVVRIMTIHSSKGLEFPVVFLSDSGKRINTKDIDASLLLNLYHGIAMDCLDLKIKIKYPTLIKEAIKIKTKEEIIAEEMRMLYVALTRAKEKLIITGAKTDAFKYVEDIKNLAETYTIHSKNKIKYSISPYILKNKTSYLDWILLAKNINLSNSVLEIIPALNLDFEKNDYEREILKVNLNDFDTEVINALNKKLKNIDFNYKSHNKNYVKIAASRLNVTEENAIEENIDKIKMKRPKFMKKANYSNAEIGSFTHLFLQKLEFNKVYNKVELNDELENIIKSGLLDNDQAKLINLDTILNFVNTKEYLEIVNSKQEKEKQFVAQFTATEIENIVKKSNRNKNEKNNNEDETVLIQGMIDLYYITENNSLKILDYKTDNTDIETIKERYETQMLVYKNALEKALKRKVDQILIYSTINNKYIEIKNDIVYN